MKGGVYCMIFDDVPLSFPEIMYRDVKLIGDVLESISFWDPGLLYSALLYFVKQYIPFVTLGLSINK